MSLEFLKKYNIRAKKSLWQNFLVNEEILNQIVEIIEITWKNIIEVGPWYWALTEKILEKKPKNLELVELDKDMIKILDDRVKNNDLKLKNTNFIVNNINILKFIPSFENYDVIANIPYYITSPILRHFLYNLKNSPKNMIILMQKDVADKIIDEKKSSVLSLIVAKKSNVFMQIFVWKQNFIPSPKVESAVLLFKTHNLYNEINDDFFLDFIKKAFVSPRKKLIKNLWSFWFDKEKLTTILNKLWFNENIRPEELNIKNFINLVKNIL